jgi:hypothetical protein
VTVGLKVAEAMMGTLGNSYQGLRDMREPSGFQLSYIIVYRVQRDGRAHADVDRNVGIRAGATGERPS